MFSQFENQELRGWTENQFGNVIKMTSSLKDFSREHDVSLTIVFDNLLKHIMDHTLMNPV